MMQAAEDASRYGRVAVLLGGNSAERDVSLKSGSAVLQALRAAGVEAVPLDPADSGFLDALAGGGFARAFIVLHGRGGEDGVMQGLLEMLGIPYTGSGVLGSALGMDKLRTKLVWQAAGIPTPAHTVFADAGEMQAGKSQLAYPVIVKPAREGSSIGISKVESADRLPEAWELAAGCDSDVIVEQWIEGREYTVGILQGEALPVIRLETPNTFYDYEAKYVSNTTQYLIPCGLDAKREAEMQAMAQSAFAAVGASGWGRVDFMVDAAGAPWFIEVNTVPGLTDHSLVPMAAEAAGCDFQALVCRILDTSFEQALPAGGEVQRAKA